MRQGIGFGLRRAVSGLAVAILLAACAGSAPPPTAAELPLHLTDQQFDLAWRLTLEPTRTEATGLVGRRSREISDVWLQLVGLDAAETIVSFSTLAHIHWGSPWDMEPFTLVLRPRGGEQRFEVRVRSYSYQEGAPTKG
jgi:hypothetical protein